MLLVGDTSMVPIEIVMRAPVVALDTETTGLHPPRDRAFFVSLASAAGSCYVDMRTDYDVARRALSAYRGRYVAHGAAFDIRSLAAAGILLDASQFDDTVIRAVAIDEHLFSYELDSLCSKYLGKKKDAEIYNDLARVFGGRSTRNVQMPNIHRAPPELIAPYAIRDAELCLELYEWQSRRIEVDGLQQIVDFEREKMPKLIGMALHGIRVDLGRAESSMRGLTPIINELQGKVDRMAGFEVNVNSPGDIQRLFDPTQTEYGWVTKYGDHVPATDTGRPSFAAAAMREMSSDTGRMVVELRSLLRTRDTFLRLHVLGHAVGDRVYPHINQSKTDSGAGTGTGRLSYTAPALQQIPSRNMRVAEQVKSVFLPDEGQVWLDTDLASFEVRVFASWAARYNDAIIRAYDENPELDFHAYVASLTGLPRSANYSGQPNAKQLNLSMIFNSGNGAIADKMGMPWEWASFTAKDGKVIKYKKAGPEAEAVIAQYHHKLPGVREFARDSRERVMARHACGGTGFVFTSEGRRLRFPDIRKAYKASGLLIQATAADLNKRFISVLYDEAIDCGGRLLLNTHDSYSLSLPKDGIEESARRTKGAIERVRCIKVPIVLEVNKPGNNWFDSWSADRWL